MTSLPCREGRPRQDECIGCSNGQGMVISEFVPVYPGALLHGCQSIWMPMNTTKRFVYIHQERGELQRGLPVTLLTGRVVEPHEVMTPGSPGPLLVIIDCPSEAHLMTIMEEDQGPLSRWTVSPRCNCWKYFHIGFGQSAMIVCAILYIWHIYIYIYIYVCVCIDHASNDNSLDNIL